MQDIEETVEVDGRLRPGCSAAFSVLVDSSGRVLARPVPGSPPADAGDTEEGLVVVAEVRNEKVRARRSVSGKAVVVLRAFIAAVFTRCQLTNYELWGRRHAGKCCMNTALHPFVSCF